MLNGTAERNCGLAVARGQWSCTTTMPPPYSARGAEKTVGLQARQSQPPNSARAMMRATMATSALSSAPSCSRNRKPEEAAPPPGKHRREVQREALDAERRALKLRPELSRPIEEVLALPVHGSHQSTSVREAMGVKPAPQYLRCLLDAFDLHPTSPPGWFPPLSEPPPLPAPRKLDAPMRQRRSLFGAAALEASGASGSADPQPEPHPFGAALVPPLPLSETRLSPRPPSGGSMASKPSLRPRTVPDQMGKRATRPPSSSRRAPALDVDVAEGAPAVSTAPRSKPPRSKPPRSKPRLRPRPCCLSLAPAA